MFDSRERTKARVVPRNIFPENMEEYGLERLSLSSSILSGFPRACCLIIKDTEGEGENRLRFAGCLIIQDTVLNEQHDESEKQRRVRKDHGHPV